jgi:hypothetical protein
MGGWGGYSTKTPGYKFILIINNPEPISRKISLVSFLLLRYLRVASSVPLKSRPEVK